MTEEEAIKYLQQLYPNDGHCWLDEQRIEAIGMAVKALQEEPVSEDLESEIQRYYVDWDEHPEYVQTARHFAKWQKEQMMKGAIEAYIRRNKYTKKNVLNGLDVTCDAIQKFNGGDKVKVVVIKED